MGDN